MENKYLHEVIATAIIAKDNKFLITRRATKKKRYPGYWTVPGGHLEIDDYKDLPQDEKGYWRNVLERALMREVKEEVGLTIGNIRYLTSMAIIHDDGSPSVVISCIAEYVSGEVVLQKEEADKYGWVSSDEAKNYLLLGSIYDELLLAEKKLINTT